MPTLTLTFDDDFIAQAQTYAERKGINLASLFAAATWPIIAPPRQCQLLSPAITELAGCIDLPPDFNYKEAIVNWRYEDYERSINQL